jgi:MFS family permease
MDHTGAVIGPLLAILTLLILFLGFRIADPEKALRWTFIAAMVPGLLAVLTIIFFVKEPREENRNPGSFRLSLRDFDGNFKRYLLIMLLFTLGNSSDAFLLFRVEESIRKSGAVVKIVESITPLNEMVSRFGDEGVKTTVINLLFLPLVWAFFHIIKALFSIPLGALSDRIGRKKVIITGWVIYGFVYFSFAGLVFLPAGAQVIATFILFAIYALFYAFSEGAEKAFVADLVGSEKRGTAYGLFNFAVGLGALPSSILFGSLYALFDKLIPGFGGTVAFSFGGTIAVISMILLSVKVREMKIAIGQK